MVWNSVFKMDKLISQARKLNPTFKMPVLVVMADGDPALLPNLLHEGTFPLLLASSSQMLCMCRYAWHWASCIHINWLLHKDCEMSYLICSWQSGSHLHCENTA
jgi:hypothetical protein